MSYKRMQCTGWYLQLSAAGTDLVAALTQPAFCRHEAVRMEVAFLSKYVTFLRSVRNALAAVPGSIPQNQEFLKSFGTKRVIESLEMSPVLSSSVLILTFSAPTGGLSFCVGSTRSRSAAAWFARSEPSGQRSLCKQF